MGGGCIVGEGIYRIWQLGVILRSIKNSADFCESITISWHTDNSLGRLCHGLSRRTEEMAASGVCCGGLIRATMPSRTWIMIWLMEQRMRLAQDEVDRNHEEFLKILPQILQHHRDRYALMKGGKILGYFSRAVHLGAI